MNNLTFFVNEKKVVPDPSVVGIDWNLAKFLRNILHLTGTKVSCGIGGCGACTVLISRYSSDDKCVKHTSVNACITPLFSLHGAHILTVEGLSDSNSYHKIQEAMAMGNATQCGFCSPGFVMSVFGLQAEDCSNEATACISKLKTAFQGNLCRCTGYRPILEAFYKRSLCKANCDEESNGCTADVEDILKPTTSSPCIEAKRTVTTGNCNGVLKRIEDILEKESRTLTPMTSSENWCVPICIEDINKVVQGRNFKIVSGGTSEEFWKSVALSRPNVVVDLSKVKEMRFVQLSDSSLKLGASLTISDMQKELKSLISTLPEPKTKILKALLKMTEVYASGQVRRAATIGGSLMVESHASDLQTAAKGFELKNNFISIQGQSKAILQSVEIPLTENIRYAWFGKIRRRKDFDLALMNVAVKSVQIGENVEEITACFGGTLIRRFVIKDTVSNTSKTDEPLLEFTTKVLQEAVANQNPDEVKLNPSVGNFIETTAISLMKKLRDFVEKNSEYGSEKHLRIFKTTRLVTKPEPGQSPDDLVHREIPHASAIKHVTGEAKYCDDIPKYKNELEIALVLSKKPHAKIIKVDFTEALKIKGIVGFVSHRDVLPGKNCFGLVEKDEEIFASEKVTCYGQIIAAVLGESRELAAKAANLVHIEYEELEPVIFSNEDAIKHNSFYSNYDMKLSKGDCDTVFDDGQHNVISGEVKVGSQEHFYLETQSCIVIPNGEDGEMEIISSTQNPTGVQMEVANVLCLPAHKIVVKVKRIGGGFGGKESRCLMIALPTAIAAQKFGRPVRCVLSREEDMIITGKRGTYLTQHKVAFDSEGKMLALRMTVYIGAGNSVDVTMAEIERVIVNLDNAYNIPNLDLKGYILKTNVASNTVFRGTGAPQAAFLIENIVDTIATYLRKEASQVRSLQIYKESDFTPYGQSLKDSTVLKCWNECLRTSNYLEKKKEVEAFNRENSYVKRGISINPINYGVGYTVLHLNQGSALVHIYIDGSVLISHGGVEIGQGVHTKMIQVATRALGISAEKIRIMETATDKVPNTTPSSASMTSDLNGGAVMNACKKLIERLQPYKDKKPEATWEEIVQDAYTDRVSLSATGFYKVPEMGWNASAVQGNPWSYFSSGTACSVVELDCLTGQFQILSTDIVVDVGKSLNPSIDVGQIEGAFLQGVGLFLLEELVYDGNGRLCTAGPLTYKIPTANDTPLEFNVSFLMGPGNPKAIYSSKTVGEPPILLATSAFFAVKDAIRAYREANNKDINFRLDSPATVEKILLACHTIFDEMTNVNI